MTKRNGIELRENVYSIFKHTVKILVEKRRGAAGFHVILFVREIGKSLYRKSGGWWTLLVITDVAAL